MQSNWEAAHSKALREYLAKGMSFSEAADELNAKFGTSYSRSSAIGRARRMGLASADRPGESLKHGPKRPPKDPAPLLDEPRQRHVPELKRPITTFGPAKLPRLRCIEIVPRRLTLVDLEPGDCRYPYGGDEEGEAITFCGHPQREGSSYCAQHFHLTRNPDLPTGRGSGAVLLRVVEAA